MRTIPSALLTHIQSGGTSLAKLWLVERRDGELLAFTDHDEPIWYDGVQYLPTSAFDASAISTRSEMNVDNLDAKGIMAEDGIDAASIEYGMWDGARVTMFEINWESPSDGAVVLRTGEIGQIQREGAAFNVEIRGLMQYLQNNIGRVVAASCDADLGDARCGVDLEALRVAGTVTATHGKRSFTDMGLSADDGYFTFGVLTWSTGSSSDGGANAGLSMEVKSHTLTSDGHVIVLQLDMPFPIEEGDEYTITPGCNKLGRNGDCANKFDNYNRFRGFEDLPGQTQVLLVGGQ